jgi:RNA polymerase sigma-70 factor (ECF subfamily)
MPENEQNDLIPTRASLLSRLKDWQDEDSWRTFFDTYWRLIYSAAIKAGLTDAEAQDTVQETLVSVMKNMPDFHYDSSKGSFKSWLLCLTRWRIVDEFRKRQLRDDESVDNVGFGGETIPIDQIAAPSEREMEALWDEEWERNLLDAALDTVKKTVDPKHFQIFHLYMVKKWPVSKIVKTMNVSPGFIYLTKHRINPLIKKEVIRLRSQFL